MSETICVSTTEEAADCLYGQYDSRDLRALASNLGVSRERGDTARQTANRIATQDPQMTARILENDWEVDIEATEFRDTRSVGEKHISLNEAVKRARHSGVEHKLNSLKRATKDLASHNVTVDWEVGSKVRGAVDYMDVTGYDPGFTVVHIKPSDDADMHWALEARAQVHLSPRGRCTMLKADDKEYIDRNTKKPRKQWRLGMKRIQSFYNPE